MNRLLGAIGLRRLLLLVVWWSFRPWPPTGTSPVLDAVVGEETVRAFVVVCWLVATLLIPTVALWWAAGVLLPVDRAEARALLDAYAERHRGERGQGQFTLHQLLELSDRDVATLRRLVATADRDWRDLQEWRSRRLLVATL